MSSLEELKERILSIMGNGSKFNPRKINRTYEEKWHKTIVSTYTSLRHSDVRNVYQILQLVLGNDFPHRRKGNRQKVATCRNDISPELKSDVVEKDIHQKIPETECVSKDSPIIINDDAEDNTVENNNHSENISPATFEQCLLFQKIHVVYTKLRLAVLMQNMSVNEILLDNLIIMFTQNFHEQFLKAKVLQHYVSKVPTSDCDYISLFLQNYCGDIFCITENKTRPCVKKVKLRKPFAEVFNEMHDQLMKGLERLNIQIAKIVIPYEMHMGVPSNEHIGVSRVFDRRGIPCTMLSFPAIYSASVKYTTTISQLDMKVSEIRDRLCENRELVHIATICKELCAWYGVTSLQQLHITDKIQLRSEGDIPALLSIMKEQGRANAFIHSFTACRNVCTIHELEKELCKMVSKGSFNALRLGPLQKQLLIFDYFQFPLDIVEIPKITSLIVFKSIWKFMSKSKDKGKKENNHFALKDFMEYFAEENNLENPFACGVRIKSFGLAISTIKRVQFGDWNNMKEVGKSFNESLQKELTEYLAVKSNEFIYTVKKMSESFVASSTIDYMNEMYNMLVNIKKDASKWSSDSLCLVNFSKSAINVLTVIKNNPLMSKIFQMLLVVAPLKASQCDDVDVLNYLGFKNVISNFLEEEKAKNCEDKWNLEPVSKCSIVKATKEWIEKNTDLSIHSLNRIEKEITMEMNAELKDFHQLGHGSFLTFLSTNKELNSYLKNFLTSTTQVSLVTSGWKHENVQEFITQCGSDKTEDEILEALNQQLASSELLCLPEMKNQCASMEFLFHYQQALLCGSEAIKSNYEELSEIACEKIPAVSYMQNIGKAIDWYNIFQPTLGVIKNFVASNFKSKDLPYFFLEVNENNLLKVEKDCSVSRFTQAFLALDPTETCHCLVSIICFHGNVSNAPLQMLSDIAQRSLLDSRCNEQQLLKFCLECFLILPFYMLCSVVVKIFIKPLSTLYGDLCVPQKLLQACRDGFCRERLKMLGHQLSINQWIDSQSLDDAAMSSVDINLAGKSDVKVTQVKGSTDIVIQITPQPLCEVKRTIQKAISDDQTQKVDAGNQRAFIEHIRKQQFGVGVVLGETETELLAVHRQREGRSLQRLSNELYSKDSHFVLELIQNADDNEYTGDETPALVFLLEDDRVSILNNEVGFTEQNISALCDVGRSTKQAHKKGYIGQKGIGFKSVFRVTDCPEIHSNGFHIKFDATSDANGYILPQWTEEILVEVQTSKPFSSTTCIVLPLKQSLQCFKSRFHDIHPSLLLFLNRLETIIIDDKVTDSFQLLRKERVDENLLQLSQNNEYCLWFVVTKETSIEVAGDNKVTDISLAFPLVQERELPRQPVFAYLPLRSYGFRFIIQADFEVPSSREDIYRNSIWNQCILEAIPGLAVKSLHTFMMHPSYKGIEGVITCLKFFDFKEQIVGQFQQVARAITRALQQEECMPILSDGELKFALPSTTVFYSSVVSPLMLSSYAGVSYVHPLIEERVGRSVLLQLGVKELSLEQLVDICNGVVREHENCKKLARSELHKWIGEWLNLVYLCLQKTRESSETAYSIIASLTIFPMSDSRLVNLVDTVVFFPPDKSINDDSNTKQKDIFRLIEDDIDILSHEMVAGMEGVEREHVIRLLQNLGVKQISPLEIIHSHILPMFKLHECKSDKLLIAWVVYIQHHYQRHHQSIDTAELRTCLVLLTSCGRHATNNTDPVFFSSAYANSVDLPTHFPSVELSLVSDAYLKGMSQFEKSAMKRFLEVVGVRNPLTLHRHIKQMDSGELKLSCWKNEYSSWPSTADGLYVIEDETCEVSSKVLSVGAHKDMKNLMLLLDKYWNERYKKQLKCQVKTTKGQVIGNTFSSFYSQVCNSCWLFSDENLTTAYHPKDLFHRSKQTYHLLSSKVPYVSKQVQSLDFLSAVGVCTELTCHKFMKEFNKWRIEDGFDTTYGHIMAIYRYLHEGRELLNPLLKSRVIFLPSSDYLPQRYDDSSQVSGNFLLLDALCWENPCDFLEVSLASTRVLKGFYPKDMKHFFVHILSVRRFPPINEFLEFAQSIASKTTLPNKPACDKLFTIFSMLGEMCISETKRFNDIPWHSFDPEKQYHDLGACLEHDGGYSNALFFQLIFPVSKNQFASLSQQPLLSTRETLTDIYQEHVPVISFQAIAERIGKGSGERKLLKIMLFFKACGIELLSDLNFGPEVITVDMRPTCKRWESILNEMCPIIQRFLAAKQPLVYKEMCARDFQTYLSASKLFSVNSLEAVYRLKGRTDVNISRLQPACVQHICTTNAHVYINRQHDDNYDDVMKELVKLFVANEDEEILLDFLITYNIVEKKESFLKRKRIDPVQEDAWYFTECVEVVAEDTEPVVAAETPVNGLTCWPPRAKSRVEASVNGKMNFAPNNSQQHLTGEKLPDSVEYPYKETRKSKEGNIANTMRHPSMNEPARQRENATEQTGEKDEGNVSFENRLHPPSKNDFSRQKGNSSGEISKNSEGNVPPESPLQASMKVLTIPENTVPPVLDLVYEDMPLVIEDDVLNVVDCRQSTDKSAGELGEGVVYQQLCAVYAKEIAQEDMRIIWLNQTGEQGQPYDIQLVFLNQDRDPVYIEVKSSYRSDKESFEISPNQLQFAFKHRENFHLVRVTGLQSKDLKIRRLANLNKYLDNKSVRLYMVL